MIEVAFLGSLLRDAESRTSKNGRPYLRFTCRVGDGDAVQWISVTAFDPTAIEQADRFTKGTAVYCEGSIKLDEWQAAAGATRHGLSCLSWHCRLAAIGRNKPPRDARRERRPAAEPNDFHSDDSGF
jgi:single-stranded DNA-binding protein